MFRLATVPSQPPRQWVLAVLSPGVKLPGCESSPGLKQAGCKSDHSPPSSAKVKNE